MAGYMSHLKPGLSSSRKSSDQETIQTSDLFDYPTSHESHQDESHEECHSPPRYTKIGSLGKRPDRNSQKHPVKLPRLCSFVSASSVSSIASSSHSSSSDNDEATDSSDAVLGESLNSLLTKEDEVEINTNADGCDGGLGQKMMENMGFVHGKGLGKHGQGITAPIEASQQRGRRGLGFHLKEELEPATNLTWDADNEYVQVVEEVEWMPRYSGDFPNFNTLSKWVSEGPVKLKLDNETHFCEQEVLDGVLNEKSVFDDLDEREKNRARLRANPFETIGKAFFQNRAALKMANMDAMFDFMFTRPVDESGKSMVLPNELLYFADVCAAPGGFSEYVLWRRKTDSSGFCDAKGFGFTLKDNDFKLDDFFAAPAEFFEPHYGINGVEGDGDVYVPNNITNFRNFVLSSTGHRGVHFMMADGGFSVEGRENIQEILSKRIYLCQFLVALGIVRTGGHFVCKLFDIFTPFSVGLVYLMYCSFKHVAIHKPNSSRPANSERYIICKWKREGIEDIYNYLFEVNERMHQRGEDFPLDIREVVSLDVLKGDEEFYRYISNSNNMLGRRQIVSLKKIQVYSRDTQLIEERQLELCRQSLSLWQLPERTRMAKHRGGDPRAKFAALLDKEGQDTLIPGPVDLTPQNLSEKVHSMYDFRFVFLASSRDGRKDQAFYLGMGGKNVFKWEGSSNKRWLRIDTKVELPPDTLVYGEMATEYKGEYKAQRKLTAFHLIDALVLNGFDVRDLHLVERHEYLKKFAAAINKPGRPDLAPIRCKPLFRLEHIKEFLQPPRLQFRVLKGGSVPRRAFCETDDPDDKNAHFTVCSGLLLLKITQEPWMMAFSRSASRKYFFNTMTKASTFECKKEVIAPFKTSYNAGAVWWWDVGVRIFDSENAVPGRLHLSDFLSAVSQK